MADWIALDDNTQKALREALGPYGQIGTAQGSPLRSALDSEDECVILLPTTEEGYARLVTVKRRKASEVVEERPSKKEEYVGTGFLGLSGSEEEEPEPSGKKKSWWKKLVE